MAIDSIRRDPAMDLTGIRVDNLSDLTQGFDNDVPDLGGGIAHSACGQAFEPGGGLFYGILDSITGLFVTTILKKHV